jgi:CPA1 family monovalent cation:H+ antiporter
LVAHLAFFAGLLIAAYLFAQIAHHAGLPAAAATTLVGITAAGMFPDAATIALTPVTIALFLPAIIFDGAWEIDGAALRRRTLTIVILAVPGVLITAAIVAGGAVLAGLAVIPAFTLGAMLAATDPVAVLALFRTLRIPEDLRTIVEGESIANDGVAAVLTTTLVGFAMVGARAPAPSIPIAVLQALYSSGVGIAIGAALAFVAARFVRASVPPAAAIAVTLVVAYGSYALATLAGTSGIFASAAAGITLRAAAFAKGDRENVARAWDGIGFVANAIVFLLVGLNLKFERIFHEPLLIGATIATVILARIVLSYALAPIGARPKLPTGWRHTIALAGLRGGLSLALALGLPLDFPARAQILDAVFAVVFGTVVIGGWTLGPILRRVRTLRTS